MDADDADLFGFSVDLTDGFYQFKCEKMASFFGLDFRATVREINDLIGEPLGNIYDEIDQAQVAKNDNAIPDTTLWDEAVLKPVGALAKEIEFIIGGRNHSQEVKALELIRTRQSYQYKKNVRPSFANYMKFTYSPLVFDKS